MFISIHKCRPKDHPFPILAWLIMIMQGMKPWDEKAYSHMAFSYESATGRTKFGDSTSHGVRDMISDIFLKRYEVVETIHINADCTLTGFLDWFETIEGAFYDKLQIFGLLARSLSIISFNELGYNLKRLTCNEVVLYILIRFKGLKVKDSDDWDLNRTWSKACEYKIGE